MQAACVAAADRQAADSKAANRDGADGKRAQRERTDRHGADRKHTRRTCADGALWLRSCSGDGRGRGILNRVHTDSFRKGAPAARVVASDRLDHMACGPRRAIVADDQTCIGSHWSHELRADLPERRHRITAISPAKVPPPGAGLAAALQIMGGATGMPDVDVIFATGTAEPAPAVEAELRIGAAAHPSPDDPADPHGRFVTEVATAGRRRQPSGGLSQRLPVS